MKLYVWNKPYPVSYGRSLLLVVAETLEDAKAEAQKGTCWEYGEFARPTFGDSIVLGDPLRVVDVPCAEWHEWSE